jgi:AcrR family transcriptional regulator
MGRRGRETSTAAVRPKSSRRKGRSDTIEHVARRPVQERSRQRFELILAAVEELLQTANIEDISFYDIARRAGISPASIHYLFPTMTALRIELGKRHLQISTDDVIDAHRVLARMRNPSWQDWLHEMGRRARDQANSKRHIAESWLAPMAHRDSRLAAIEQNNKIGRSLHESLREVFVVPEIPGLEHKFALAAEIADAIWSRAYVLHGHIDDDSFEESIRIQIAYLRTVLPETLPLARDIGGADAGTAP